MPHLPDLWLQRQHDGDLRGFRLWIARRHLTGCQRCRCRLQQWRDLDRATQSLPPVAPPAHTRTAVLAGPPDGSIPFPVGPGAAAAAAKRHGIPVVAGSVVLIVGLIVAGRNQLDAGTPDMTFTTPDPDVLHITYRDAGRFSGEDSVSIRGTLRTADSWTEGPEIQPSRIGVLHRAGRNRFEGNVPLARNTVLGVFAAERIDGSEVDHNFGRFWQWPEAPGSIAAMEQAILAATQRNMVTAHLAAEAMVRAYPDSPVGINHLLFTLSALQPSDSTLAVRTRAIETYQSAKARLLASDGMTVQEAYAMYNLSMYADFSEAVQWREIMRVRWPHDPRTVFALITDPGADDSIHRTLLESLGEHMPPFAINNALGMAQVNEDPEDLRFWARHAVEADPLATADIARALAANPAHRGTALALLQRFREDNSALSVFRRLGENTHQFAQRLRKTVVDSRAVLGQLMADAGEVTESINILADVSNDTWEGSLHHRLAQLHLAAGNMTGAARFITRLLVDPAWQDTGAVLRSRIPNSESIRWNALRNEAEGAMMTISAREMISRSVRGTSVSTGTGAAVDLETILAGRPAVVLIVSPSGLGSRRALEELDALTPLIESMGGRTMGLVAPFPDGGGARHAFDSYRFPSYLASFNAMTAFDVWGTPIFCVLDAEGAIRFLGVTAASLPRRIKVLNTISTRVLADDG